MYNVKRSIRIKPAVFLLLVVFPFLPCRFRSEK